MPSGKQRSSANAPDSFSISVNERILKECNDLYATEERGKVHVTILMMWLHVDNCIKSSFENLEFQFYLHIYVTIYFSGLITIAKGLGLNLLAPRKKITIVLLGNHSAGKSSFINWYNFYNNNSLFVSRVILIWKNSCLSVKNYNYYLHIIFYRSSSFKKDKLKLYTGFPIPHMYNCYVVRDF